MAHTRTDLMGDLFRLLGLATLEDDIDLDALEVAPECAEFAVKLLKAWRGLSSGIVSDKAWIYEEGALVMYTSTRLLISGTSCMRRLSKAPHISARVARNQEQSLSSRSGLGSPRDALARGLRQSASASDILSSTITTH
jgi:hypothetical protein